MLVVTVPMILYSSYIILRDNGRPESASFSYWSNLFIFLSAVSQKEYLNKNTGRKINSFLGI